MNSTAAKPTQAEDFRVRVAREKRDRMRARLLSAALDLYQPGRRAPAVIDDVIRAANVSRGTFYKYFDSLEQLVAELGAAQADELITAFDAVFAPLADAAVRVAAGPVMTLARAAMAPRWAAFASHVDYVDYMAEREEMQQIISGRLADARAAGVARFSSLTAATDMTIGATVEGVRRIAHGQQRHRVYIMDMAAMIMAGIGMSAALAAIATEQAWQQLAAHSAGFSWWRPLPAD